ncbi:MAG: hypothetical protein LBI72_04210 [Flavobacteriaceae bacterium]|jgi:hypothetical protein|nr:hypothetical protein [Flavobacteriaceae bacterium]
MKTLNKEQLTHLDNFLLMHYQLKYDEVREEVVDHIACEIEEKMCVGASYEEAFKVTLSKWNGTLRSSTMGIYSGIPNFIAKQMMRSDLKHQVVSIVSICAVLFVNDFLQVINDALIVKLSLTLSVVTTIGVRGTLFYLKNEDSLRMTFYKTQLSGVFLCSLIVSTVALFNNNYLTESINVFPNIVLAFMALAVGMFAVDFVNKLWKEHRRILMS